MLIILGKCYKLNVVYAAKNPFWGLTSFKPVLDVSPFKLEIDKKVIPTMVFLQTFYLEATTRIAAGGDNYGNTAIKNGNGDSGSDDNGSRSDSTFCSNRYLNGNGDFSSNGNNKNSNSYFDSG
jgi:hypothetical protein